MAKFFVLNHQNVESMLTNGSPKGGSVIETVVWIKALHELGHDIFQAKYEEEDRSLIDEFSWINLVSIYNSKKNKKRLVWFSYRFPKVFMALKNSGCDYLFDSTPTRRSFFISLMCKHLGMKYLIRLANDKNIDFSLDSNHSRVQTYLMHRAYKMADFIVAQNDFQYWKLKEMYPSKKIEKLHNPIVIKHTYLKPREKMDGYIAWVANFRHQKNLKLLYEIALCFPNEEFKIAGQPLLPMDGETEEYFGRLQKLTNVTFLGVISQSKILDFLASAKFLLSTSRYEGFSNTFLEAMMVGLPILTTQKVNPDGIIDKFHLGLLYKSKEDLKVVFECLNESSYIQISNNCINYLVENHDHINLGRRLVGFLEGRKG